MLSNDVLTLESERNSDSFCLSLLFRRAIAFSSSEENSLTSSIN